MSCNCHLNEFLVFFGQIGNLDVVNKRASYTCSFAIKSWWGSWEVITYDTFIQGIVWFFFYANLALVSVIVVSKPTMMFWEHIFKACICLCMYYSKNLGKVSYIMIIFFGEPSPFFFKYWVFIVLFRRIWENVTITLEIINFIYRVNGKVFVRLDF